MFQYKVYQGMQTEKTSGPKDQMSNWYVPAGIDPGGMILHNIKKNTYFDMIVSPEKRLAATSTCTYIQIIYQDKKTNPCKT